MNISPITATVLVAITLIVLLLMLGIKSQGAGSSKAKLPYKRKESLNSANEQAFTSALLHGLDSRYYVACKVRIADVLDVSFRKRNKNDQRWWGYFRRISSKHVDIVVCEKNGGRMLLAIEIDDRSHNQRSRQQRDKFVDQAFDSAGMPLIRFKAQGWYQSQKIQDALKPYLDTINI